MSMKKTFVTICLAMISIIAFAQKNYIFVRCAVQSADTDDYRINLSGDIPSNIKAKYTYESIGKILSMLSSEGYNVELMTSDNSLNFLLSKNSNSSQTRVQTVASDDDNVTEVARYNLQGMPVRNNEKGVQIIVYSNYTTKTVIVQ